MMQGRHDGLITEYLKRLPGTSAEMSMRDQEHRYRALDNELQALDGAPFIIEDGAGGVVGIAMAGPKKGLAIVALVPDQQVVEVRLIGRPSGTVLIKSTPVDDDFDTSYRLTIEHESLPNGSVIYQTSSKGEFERAYPAFAEAFGP